MLTTTRRRSPRWVDKNNSVDTSDKKYDPLEGIGNQTESDTPRKASREKKTVKSNKRSSRSKATSTSNKKRKVTAKIKDGDKEETLVALPRTREKELLSSKETSYVLGVDEAGRGPLCGPVVAAAVMIMTEDDSACTIPGIVDSKKIITEAAREELYEKLVALPPSQLRWGVSIQSAQRIDEINILQATLEGMRRASCAVLGIEDESSARIVGKASIEEQGCYVICSGGIEVKEGKKHPYFEAKIDPKTVYALIDGNRVPKELPFPAEAMVKGDGREYCIAAASILAKVTRDRLMHAYDELYPGYDWAQNKGYPTQAHMACVKRLGATPIHRRTFAPLKHMNLDADGKILPTKKEKKDNKTS